MKLKLSTVSTGYYLTSYIIPITRMICHCHIYCHDNASGGIILLQLQVLLTAIVYIIVCSEIVAETEGSSCVHTLVVGMVTGNTLLAK